MTALRRRWIAPVAAMLLAGTMMLGGPAASARQAEPQALPVAIHSGTCENPTAEPAYDAGLAEPVQRTGETEAEGVTGDDQGEGADQTPAAGAAGAAQTVPAEDQEDEQQAQQAAQQLRETVYKADTELEDVDPQELIAAPHVVLVHLSEDEFSTYLACGEIQPLVEENQLVVPLRPVGQSDFFGVALIAEDGSEAAAFLFRGLQQQGPAAATPAPQPPPASPAPTETPVGTAVVEETVVVTRTEVVPAPTATAQAEG